MRKLASSTTRKFLIAVMLISIVALSPVAPFYAPNSTASLQGDNSGSVGDLGQSQRLMSDPPASPRPVDESAVGFDAASGSGRTVNLPSTGTNDLPVTLGYGWGGSKLYASILGLWDRRQWVIGGGFDTGSGKTSGQWTYREYDPPSQDDGNWIQNTPTTGQYVYASLPHPGGSRTYYNGEFSAWNETVSINRGTVLEAKLSLRYYPTFDTVNFGRGEFLIYARVAGHLVWYTDFKTIKDTSRANKWNSIVDVDILQDVNGTTTFNLPAVQNVLISIGVWYHADSATYTFPASANRAYFDNVTMYLKTYARSEQLQLTVREPSSGVSSSVTSSTWGAGSAVLTGFTIGPAPLQTTYYFDFTSNVTSPATGSFAANATIYVSRHKSATTTFENKGSNVEWSVSLATAFEQYGQPLSTTGYTKYYFNVTVPSDWDFTTCQDPSGRTHNIDTETNNFTIIPAGSLAILRVNVTRMGSYSIPPDYTPYVIHALSTNYVRKLWTQLQSGSTWVNMTKFYPQNTTRFASYIFGSSPVSSGIANLTIRGPPIYNASPVILKTITGVTPVSGFANFSVTWTGNDVAGNYSAQVDWVDNTLGEAGSLSWAFNITHKFRMAVVVPGSGDVIVKNKVMMSPPTTVSIMDYHTNSSVVANVYGSVKWRPGRWDKFTTYSPQNATYTNQTVVPDSLTTGAQYWLAANASIGWYDKATSNSTFWIGTAAIMNPPAQSITIYYTESQTYYLQLVGISYTEQGGAFITNATIELLAGASSNQSIVRWDARFVEDYSQSSSSIYSGVVYVGTFSESVKAIPSAPTYSVLFRLSQGHYIETKYFTFKLTVFTAPSYLSLVTGYNNQYVFWGATAQIKLDYSTYWSYGGRSLPPTAVRNSTLSPSYAPPFVRVYSDWAGSWTATHLGFDQPGVYTLYANTTLFTTPTDDGNGAGETTFNVFFNKSYYTDSNPVPITLHIKRLTTSMTGVIQQNGGVMTSTNTSSTYSRDPKTIFVWYNDTHTGAPIGVGGATLGYTFRSSLGTFLGSGSLTAHPTLQGLYNMTLPGTLTDQNPGTYYLYVDASKGSYYVVRQLTVTLNILRIPSIVGTYVLGEDDTHVIGTEMTVLKDATFTIYLWFNDTHNGVPVPGAETHLTYSSVRFGSGQVTPVTGVPGLYSVSFQAYDAGDWAITFSADAPLYEPQSLTFRVIVTTPPSFNIVQVVFVGVGGGGIVLAAVLGMLLLRRARVPFIIKKIDESLKLIGKGDHEAATPVALRSREEIVVGITQERIDVFGRRPVGPEAGEGASEAASAVTPETSALKKELEAVEPKEKSGEVIEEVEMDTLDEELQKLEKSEDKEKLPDGAKEVRDVVEKYKQSKKKKE